MNYLLCSDIHSFYHLWMETLEEANYSPDSDILVILGDLLDRGPDPVSCLKFVNSIPASKKILIHGNHESLIEELYQRKEIRSHDIHNGTADTIYKIADNVSDPYRMPEILKTYLDSTVPFAEVGDLIFTHGWIPCLHEQDMYTPLPDYHMGSWEAASWINGMLAWELGVRVPDKTICCGHWHTSWGHSILRNDGREFPNKYSTNPDHRYANFSPFIDEGIIAIDACTAYSHRVNAVRVNEKGEILYKSERSFRI